MKKILTCVMALSMLITLSSCEKDAPEINFSQTTTVGFDLSEIIKALNDSSVELAEKLDLINDAIESMDLTISQKMDVLKAAIESQGIDMGAKLELIKNAIESQGIDLNAKLGLIENAITQGLLDIKDEIKATKTALIESLDENFAATKESLDAVNKALSKIITDASIYEYDKTQKHLIMSNSAWEILDTDKELAAVFMGILPTTTFTLTAKPINAAGYTITTKTKAGVPETFGLYRRRNAVWYNKNDKTVVPAGDTEGKDYDREILVPALQVIETYGTVNYTCTLGKSDGSALTTETFGQYRIYAGNIFYYWFGGLNGATEKDLTINHDRNQNHTFFYDAFIDVQVNNIPATSNAN